MEIESWDEIEKKNAEAEIVKVDAAILLAQNNRLGCEINIAGMTIGICNNKKIIPALKYHKKEIEKYLNGEKNEYE